MSGAGGRVFFSYAREDAEFALRLATDLRNAGVDIWLDKLDIHPGERWDRAIEKALESSPSLLVILSPGAVDSSNVMDEVSYALEEGKTTIPVLYRDCKIPFRLRRLQYTDLATNYEQGLDQLTRYLGGAGPTPIHSEAAPKGEKRRPTNVPLPDAEPSYRGEKPRQPDLRQQATGPIKPESHKTSGRLAGAIWGALIGAVYGILSTIVVCYNDSRMDTAAELLKWMAVYAGVTTIFGAIAGAITGKSTKAIVPISAAVVVTIIAWILFFGTYQDVVITGATFGAGIVSIIVATIWTRIKKSQE